MLGLYIGAAGALSISVVASLVISVRKMTPRAPEGAAEQVDASACWGRYRLRWRELDDRRHRLSGATDVRGADVDWTTFRLRWLESLRLDERQCSQAAAVDTSLREAVRQLEVVMDLYTTHAVQYAREVGPAVHELLRRLDSGGAAPPGTKSPAAALGP